MLLFIILLLCWYWLLNWGCIMLLFIILFILLSGILGLLFILLFILLLNCKLLLGIILIPKPFFGPFGLPNKSVSSSSSSSNIPFVKKLERLNFPPPIAVFLKLFAKLFALLFGLFILSKLLLLFKKFGNLGWTFVFLSNPPSPPESSTSTDTKAGLINSFSPWLLTCSLFWLSNIFELLIGFPICCWTILWNSSGLGLLFKLLFMLLLTLLLKLLLTLLLFGSLLLFCISSCASFGTMTPCSFLISLLKSLSSSSSSRTNPINSFSLKSLEPIIIGSLKPLLFFIKLLSNTLLFILTLSSSTLFLFKDFCWSLKLMKSIPLLTISFTEL